MARDGKTLESLVRFVEERLAAPGFDIKSNVKVFDEDGHQMAELDVEVRGRLGSTDMCWLIECRDRPSEGAAPGAWIEQLAGRRERFGFNKVTAVSTTGFSRSAIDAAKRLRIELREVKSLAPENFEWMLIRSFKLRTTLVELRTAKILLDTSISQATRDAAEKTLALSQTLTRSRDGQSDSISNEFQSIVLHEGLSDGMEPGDDPKSVELEMTYDNPSDCFFLETELGAVRVERIFFDGLLRVEERDLPVVDAREYKGLEDSKAHSQVVVFDQFNAQGANVALEFHRIPESGSTHIILRKIESDSAD